MVRKEQLIEYMNALKRLEVEKLTLERTISELKYKCKSLGHRESLKSPEHNGFFGSNLDWHLYGRHGSFLFRHRFGNHLVYN